MKLLHLFFLCQFLIFPAFGQNIPSPLTPQSIGFSHAQWPYKGDLVDILVQSKPGDEEVKKPLFFFCQGSLAQPLIKYDTLGVYGVFPFSPDSLLNDYHLVIIGKPHVPLIAEKGTLKSDFTITDTAAYQRYSVRNYLDYYVDRNLAVISYLQKKPWVSKKELVVAGHSEGSTIAAKMASVSPKVTQVIYSGGNPVGRILSIIEQDRQRESYADSTHYGEEAFEYWQEVLDDRNNAEELSGDSPKTTYYFSVPSKDYLEKLKIPVLVSYGTKDYSTPFNDYLRAEMMRHDRKNFTFQAYVGTEHNFFPVLPDGSTDYTVYNWQRVADDWYAWLKKNR